MTGPETARRHGAMASAERLGPLLIVAALLAAWEAATWGGLLSVTFFPAPSTVFAALARLLGAGAVHGHVGVTLGRTLASFAIGGGAGLLLGLGMGAWPRLHRLLDPLVALAHPLPKIAMLPLILVVFGIGEASKVALGALGAFFPMLINTVAGVKQIPPTYFEVARSYGAGRSSLFTRVVVPGSLPLVFAGTRLSLNVALMLVIAGELLVAQRGLGQALWFSWQTMRIAEVYAWLFVTAALGLGLNLLLNVLSRRAMPWREGNEASVSAVRQIFGS